MCLMPKRLRGAVRTTLSPQDFFVRIFYIRTFFVAPINLCDLALPLLRLKIVAVPKRKIEEVLEEKKPSRVTRTG